MKVRARPELVTLRLEDDINPNEMTGRLFKSERIL